MSKRETFAQAACKDNVEDFLHFIQLHRNKTDPFDVEEVVQEMPRAQREAVWDSLAAMLQDVLQECPPECWQDSSDRQEHMDTETSADPKHAMAVVEGVAVVALASLNVLQDGDPYRTLLSITHTLHDVLVSLPVSAGSPELCVGSLCRAWWQKGLQHKEKFGRAAFLVSLQRSLTLKKPGTEIQRLWELRDVLLHLDFTSEENKQIIDLLLQCFHRPVYIRNDDGKRLLVFLFSLDVDLIWAIHATIKNQLEFLSRTMTSHIAEIYFRAWKKASGDFLEKIESLCIQDLMLCAIHLRRTSPVHTKVRQIVSYFQTRQRGRSLDKLLHKLYRPILWKALNAPNFEVRANATLLFTEAFPVLDPDQSCENVDQTIQKQLDTVMGLLEDPHPTVRSTATLGVCKILAKCWELLPATVITDFLKKLTGELAADSSSPDVRCSVFKSLTIVLDNAHSHPLLEKLLPTLRNSLHDSSEKVRSAFLDMLIKVKAVRAAKFWNICTMDHLLARLAMDSPSVSKRIVDLLFKSFYPVNEPEREWCCRCLTLIEMNPAAARKFYQYAHKHTAPTNIIKLMLHIRRILNSCLQNDGDLSQSNKENSFGDQPLLTKDAALVASLLEVVVILWRSLKKALEHNSEARQFTCAKFGNVLAKYFHTFEDERCTVPLVHLASFMPPTAVPTFSCGVLSRLRRMDPEAAPKQFSQLLSCLCGWGQAGDVLELITDWLTQALPVPADQAHRKRKVQIQETVTAKPGLALAYLEDLLGQTSTLQKVLALGVAPFQQLHAVLGEWQAVLCAHLSSAARDPEWPRVDVALKAFSCHGRLGLHLQHHLSEGRDYLLAMEATAAWLAEKVLPSLSGRRDADEADCDPSDPLGKQITESFLTLCRDVLLLGLADNAFRGAALHLCSLILLSDEGCWCIPAILPVLKEVADGFEPQEEQGQEEQGQEGTAAVLGVVANIFQKIIEVLARRLRKEPDEGRRLCQAAVPGLTDFLQVAQAWDGTPLCGVFSTLFAIIVVEKQHTLQKLSDTEEAVELDAVEDLPPLSSLVLPVLLKTPAVTRAFLREIASSLDSEAISTMNELAAVLHILATVRRTGQCRAGLKTAAVCVQQRLPHLAAPPPGSPNLQRLIYESSVKTLNDILDL